jgi:hypothetical protein
LAAVAAMASQKSIDLLLGRSLLSSLCATTYSRDSPCNRSALADVSGYRLASSLLLWAFIIAFLRLVPDRHLLLRVSEVQTPAAWVGHSHFTLSSCFRCCLLGCLPLLPLLYSTTLPWCLIPHTHPLRTSAFATTLRPHFTSLAHSRLSSPTVPACHSRCRASSRSSIIRRRRRRFHPFPPLSYRSPFSSSLPVLPRRCQPNTPLFLRISLRP